MSFDTPNGTRGVPLPGADQVRQHNERVIAGVRAGGMPGMNMLVLITTGRRSGARRQTPVGYFAESSGTFLVVAGAGDAARNPD
ncbi:nitroreductase family deazaflavin-dependent oxidoreductase [Actinoplanes sp. LDG1-01]|uniref:Nitroreductase family deazaflavin-dependent oxidoreductase n=1 Tax=Paractinoplanes lichenicola TaxID=2802976 RepID=A0ABS1W1E9_9ACTN|nr:nitroreductase family deazaflavin-dependent oxidoreductase [Actinoplanes lichenicola]